MPDNRTHEQRSAAIRQGWITRRANQRSEAGRKRMRTRLLKGLAEGKDITEIYPVLKNPFRWPRKEKKPVCSHPSYRVVLGWITRRKNFTPEEISEMGRRGQQALQRKRNATVE
jgi:hypothetical protein